MRWAKWPVLGVALAVSGCASPQKIEEGAWLHEQRACFLASRGDYGGAALQQRAAYKEHAKAVQRAADADEPLTVLAPPSCNLAAPTW